MKTRERKARQRELNDFLSGRPIWSKKGRAGKAHACREPSKDGEVGGAVRCCRVHCRTVAVWTASSATNCSGLCGQKVVCAYLLPPTLLSAAIPSVIWHLASGIWHLLPATPLSAENMWRIVARRKR